jgi:quinol monooxygenase YgiN
VKPERRDEFISLVKDNQRKTLELEPASLQYVVGEDTKTPNTFYMHEQFIGAEGLDAHREMPHAANWASFKSSDPFIEGGEPVIDFYFGDHTPEKAPIRSAYCVHVELCVKSELRDEFLDVIRNNQRGSNEDEQLCLQYVYGESTMEPNKFIFHEEYEGEDDGKEGFDAHTNSPHFEVWEEFVDKDPFSKEPVVNFFKLLC